MTSPLLSENSLLDALARGDTVVLPNRRAARTLRQAFDERQRARGLRAWEAANALAWKDWTHALWSALAVEGNELRLLLNSAQEHSLWREIIAASTSGRTLSSPDALAQMARSAWSLAAAHHALGRIRAAANTFDTRTFADWTESFARLAKRENYLSEAMLEDALRQHALAGALRIERSVTVAGFEELTPAQSAALQAFRSCGLPVSEAAFEWNSSPSIPAVGAVLPTPREELTFAARWIRALFANNASAATPPRVAVIVPQPDEDRGEIESIFRAALAPELQSIAADTSAAPWEFAAGAPLSPQPMIVAALALLRLIQGPLELERLSALLRSPFIGVESEQLAAARFDAQVMRRNSYLIPELDLDGLSRLIRLHSRSAPAPLYAPGWLHRLNEVRINKLRGSAPRSYAEWSEFIRELLRAANWPGERTPSAAEFATATAWDRALDQLATLDFRGSRVGFAEAAKTLEQMLGTARVNPPAAHSPVQIMRPDETEGSTFDAVVVLHATDEHWPEPVRPHPLLGWQLQQELGLAGADSSHAADRDRARAKSLIRRSAKLLVLSAAADERGKLQPSPLWQQLGVNNVAADDLLPTPPIAAPITQEIIDDDVDLPPLPSPELRGGASVLKLQAACGFLAFADMRLHAGVLDSCELGLDAGERGNLVHRALESFWSVTTSQAELRNLPSEERMRRIDNAISAAFAKLPPVSAGWSAAYVAVQRERLRRLLSRWLDLELQRGPFTVQRREQRSEILIGPLRLKVQPDRIDEVEDGFVLVDYKTGYHVHHSQWLGERPDDPQLPLYALLTEPGELQGLLFARIRPGSEMRWLGLTADRRVLPRARSKFVDLELRKDEWRSVLTSLAHDFAAGRAHVNPKSFAVNCDGCRQRLLCRVDPVALASAALEDEDEDETDG